MDIEDKTKKSVAPDIPGLKAMESTPNKEGASSPTTTDKLATAPDTAHFLKDQEVIATKGFTDVATKSVPGGPLARMAATIARNKTTAIFGGFAGTIVFILVLFGFGALTTFTLTTIEKDLYGTEDRVQADAEKKASKTIFKQMVCRALAGIPAASGTAGCSVKSDPNDPEDQKNPADQAAEEQKVADSSDNGASLTQAEDSFDFTDPTVVQRLSDQGINVVKTADNKFAGFTDSSGNPITVDDIVNNEAIWDSFQTALPNIDIGTITSMEPLSVEHAQADYDGVADSDNGNVQEEFDDTIMNGAPESELAQAEAENQPEEESKTITAAEAEESVTEVANNSSILDAADKVIENGGTESQALSAAEDVNLGSPLLVSSIASDICGVKKVADTSSASRKPEIMKLAVRHMALLLAVADQIKTGHITSKAVSDVMTIFTGDKSASPTVKDPADPGKMETNEAALPWNRSAAWLRDTGHASEVDTNPEAPNYTPDIDSSSLPTADAGNAIVSKVDTATNAIGGQFVCDLENSPIGSVANFFGNAIQMISNGFDFGASEAATIVGVAGVQLFIKMELIPDIVRYFTPVNMFGGEFSTQWMGIADMGANLGVNDYYRSEGAMPVSNSTAGSQFALASQAEQKDEDSKSFTYRTFALSNPNSLVAKIALDLPSSRLAIFSNIGSYFTGFGQELSNSFASIFRPGSISADPTTLNPSQNPTPGIAYGITQYGMPDPTKFDPVANEIYLNSTITYEGVTASRITMLGDPVNYPNAIDDTSKTDVYHCFTQPFDNTSNETSLDPICAGLGNYDYNNLTPTSQTNDNDITDANVAQSYCDYISSQTNDPDFTMSSCTQYMSGQMNNDIGHFTQYIMDVHVINEYDEITDQGNAAISSS